MSESVDAPGLSDLPLEDLVACHECDLLMRKPQLAHGEKALCPRCGYELYAHRHNVVQRSLALVIAALLLYIPANFLPIMQLNILGQSSQDTVWSGVLGLFNTDMKGVSIVVFLCSMAIPLVKLLCQLFVLLTIRFNVGRSYGLLLYRIYHHLKDWGCSRCTSWVCWWRSSSWRTWQRSLLAWAWCVSLVCCWSRSGWKW